MTPEELENQVLSGADPGTTGKAKAVIAAVLGILQVCSLFGLTVGTYVSWITGHEQIILAVISAGAGIVQTFLPSLKLKTAK
jgi:hypothetical protein